MFLRVFCSRCHLSAAWTDDAEGLLGSICANRFRCEARLLDEQLADVTLRFLAARNEPREAFVGSVVSEEVPGRAPVPRECRPLRRRFLDLRAAAGKKALFASAIAFLGAALVSRALASAYENASMLSILGELALPPLVVLLARPKASKPLFTPLISLLLAALGVHLLGVERIATNPLDGIFVATAAVGAPLALDFGFAAAGAPLRESSAWSTASADFLVALPILLALMLPSALRTARREDASLIRRLARTTTAEGHALRIERLDPRTAQEARQRVAVQAGGRTYDLSDAASEPTGAPRGKITLVVSLGGRGLPTQVELEGLRGPTMTYRKKLALTSLAAASAG